MDRFHKRIPFLNTEIDNVTMEEAVECVKILAREGKNAYVVTPNVDHIVKLEKDAEFANIYKDADLILADGKPLLWFAKGLGTPIVEKVSGSDLFPLVCEMAAKEGFRVFFFGAAEGVAGKAALVLQKRYPGLEVAGTYSPEYGFEKDSAKVEQMCSIINEACPDILFVGLGAPKQEKFFYAIRDKVNVHVALHIGASFDFVAGNIKRAPKWMSRMGLEWFYRLCKEPKRMFKRYLIDDMKIFGMYAKYKKQGKRT